MNLLFLFVTIIATIAATAGFTSTNSTTTSTNTNTTATPPALTTSSHRRLTMDESDSYFQVHSSQRPDICIEVFKTLNQVGRLWLQKCKLKGERGIERQMFGITTQGKLHPFAKPSSCIFLYNNKNLRYRKDCARILHHEKNQFMFNFFDSTIFLLGDHVTKVMTVRELEDKNEVKLQRGSSSKSTKQHWTLRFERDRFLQPAASCNSSTQPMPSGKHPSSPTSTQAPTKALLTWPPAMYRPPTTYSRINTRRDFNSYVYIWLKNNMQGEHAADQEDDLYIELVEKYG